MRQVADHLLALGHRRFLHLAAAVASWTFDVRARGTGRARSRAAPGTVAAHRPPRRSRSTGALAAADGALAGPGPRPTAIVCDDDILAAGACKAARRLGLRVPEDVSVTGFDDLALATAVDPELTTVRLAAELVGRAGHASAAGRPGGPTPPGRSRTSRCELVVRGSRPRPDRATEPAHVADPRTGSHRARRRRMSADAEPRPVSSRGSCDGTRAYSVLSGASPDSSDSDADSSRPRRTPTRRRTASSSRAS